MNDVKVERRRATLQDTYHGVDTSGIQERLTTNDIVIIPESYFGKVGVNIDSVNLIKFLRNNGITLDITGKKPADLIEKRAADITLILSVIGERVVLPILMNLVTRYIYDKIVKTRPDKNKMPIVKFEYYKKGDEEFVKYEGPADELADALGKLEGDNSTGKA